MKSDYCVVLVVDRLYGELLKELRLQMPQTPIWIVDSPSNHPVIQHCWADNKKADQFTGITSFKDCSDSTPEELVVSMLDIIEEHHGFYSHSPPWNVLK